MYADVIIPLGVEGVFTYAIPEQWRDSVRVGVLVVVPFAGKKRYTGVIRSIHHRQPENFAVKAIDCIVEEGFALSEQHLNFLLWLGEYYMAPAGEVVRAALPVVMRLESYTCVGLAETLPPEIRVGETAFKILNLLHPGEFLSIAEIGKCLKGHDILPAVKSLLDQSLITVKENVDSLFKPKREKIIRWSGRFSDEELHTFLDQLKRAPAQYTLLCNWIRYCEENGVEEIKRGDFARAIGDSPSALKALCERGILRIDTVEVSRLNGCEESGGELKILSSLQEEALQRVRACFQTLDCVLLQGVTSSGKTEVYICLIQEYLERGKQILYLLPEIALTVQIVKRLRCVFGDRVGVYHSGMSDQARAEMWRKQNGDRPYPIVLGVRSSVFLPYRQLGLVIIDEEHENSYKQKEPAPRYHGRDAAIMLAKIHGAKVLLGSATPSFESYRNATIGKYGLVELFTRFGEVKMPELLFVDVKEYRRKKLMKGCFTPILYKEMKQALDRGMQVILFQNRRGYSTYLQCDRCGAIPHCKHCDVSMTYYKYKNVLNCHYCGSLCSVPSVCQECGEGHYMQRTPGTERIEEEVRSLFPKARVARMDMDIMNNKAKYRTLIERFEEGGLDVLIGTQMVSKGLDFERVKLVGVIDADSLTGYPDFRSEERAYDMLMQVSGRSGRKGERGKVVIQVSDKTNRIYEWVAREDYRQFYTLLSKERELFRYPPFYRLIQIELRHKDENLLRQAANQLAEQLRQVLEQRVLGPAIPEVSRIREMKRVQLLVKSESGIALSRLKLFLKKTVADLQAGNKYRTLKVYFDVDPL